MIQRVQPLLAQVSSQRLQSLLTIGSLFPNLHEPLEYFSKAFDRQLAREESEHCRPSKGMAEGDREN